MQDVWRRFVHQHVRVISICYFQSLLESYLEKLILRIDFPLPAPNTLGEFELALLFHIYRIVPRHTVRLRSGSGTDDRG